MDINWTIVVDIVVPIFALIFGIVLTRILEHKAKVNYYLGHSSAFNIGTTNQLHTHSVVVANQGKKTAKGVKIIHDINPENFNVYPQREYEKTDLPEGGAEIKFSRLRPNEQVTVSYLYYPPVIWTQFNTVVKHDDGLAKAIPVILTRQFPKWQLRVLAFLTLLGTVAFIYFIIWLIRVVFLSG